MKTVRLILIALLVAALMGLSGCSGCQGKNEAKPKSIFSTKKKAATPTPAPTATPAAVKKAVAKSPTPTPTPDPEEDKSEKFKKDQEKVRRIVPQIMESFKSEEFREKLQNAAKSGANQPFINVFKDLIDDACRKEGLSFEECMVLMNEHKDDDEIKNSIDKWRDSFKYMK